MTSGCLQVPRKRQKKYKSKSWSIKIKPEHREGCHQSIRNFEEFLEEIQQTGSNSQRKNKLNLTQVQKPKPKWATVGNAGYGKRKNFLHGAWGEKKFRDNSEEGQKAALGREMEVIKGLGSAELLIQIEEENRKDYFRNSFESLHLQGNSSPTSSVEKGPHSLLTCYQPPAPQDAA